ncbi:MAG: PAS domain S-box protein [Planctomycetes bacterium]|nr:PAS domain S-box protein [Planctomycetota bacterium]
MTRTTPGHAPGSDDRHGVGGDDQLRLRSGVFSFATNPIVIEDLAGVIIDLNAAAESAYGWSRAELLGEPADVLVAPADLDRAQRIRAGCLRGEHVDESLWRQITKAGRDLPMIRSLFPLTDERGRVLALASIGKDVVAFRKRVELRERLVRAEQRAEERERRALARDLHDSVAQLLAVLRIRLSELRDRGAAALDGGATAGEALHELADLAAEIDRRVRTVMFQVAPMSLHEFGLVAGLAELAEAVEQTFKLRIAIVEKATPPRLDDDSLVTLFRGTRELLINVARHAQVDRATVVVGVQSGRVTVRVEDEGVGFDPAVVTLGFGLMGLRERLNRCGGRLQLEAARGDGTRACMLVPAPQRKAVDAAASGER